MAIIVVITIIIGVTMKIYGIPGEIGIPVGLTAGMYEILCSSKE